MVSVKGEAMRPVTRVNIEAVASGSGVSAARPCTPATASECAQGVSTRSTSRGVMARVHGLRLIPREVSPVNRFDESVAVDSSVGQARRSMAHFLTTTSVDAPPTNHPSAPTPTSIGI